MLTSCIACTAYSRYVLDIGQSEDWLALQISLLPCLLGYKVIARRLKGLQESKPPKVPNRYLTWINNYVAQDYTEAVEEGCALIEKHTSRQSPHRVEELVKIFVHATKVRLPIAAFRRQTLTHMADGDRLLEHGFRPTNRFMREQCAWQADSDELQHARHQLDCSSL
jgi:hypothetical protein